MAKAIYHTICQEWKVYFLFICFALILFSLKIYYFLLIPEELSLKGLLVLLGLGVGQEFFLPLIFFVASFFCFEKIFRFLSLLCLYIEILISAVVVLLYELAYTRLSFDFFIQIHTNIINFVLAMSPSSLFISAISIVFAVIIFLYIYIHVNMSKSRYTLCIACTLCFLSFLTIIAYQSLKTERFYKNYHTAEILARPSYEYVIDIIKDYTLYAKSTKEKWSIYPSSEDRKVLTQQGLLSNKPYDFTLSYNNVILIALESFDLAYLHKYNENIPSCVTKNMDSFASQYVSFKNFFTSDQPTDQGLHALYTSRIGLQLDREFTPSILSEFKKNGFKTTIVSGVTGMYGSNKQKMQQLYSPDSLIFSDDLARLYKRKFLGWGAETGALLDYTYSILSENKRNVIVVSTIDTHPPYNTILNKDDICLQNSVLASSPFLNTIAYVDRELNKFVEKIFLNPRLAEDTLIIITADHSATHGENYTKRKDFSPARIPLLMISKKNELKGFFDEEKYASQIDLPATLLKLFGLKVPHSFMGNDLLYKEDNAISIVHSKTLRVVDKFKQKEFPLEEKSIHSDWFWKYHRKEDRSIIFNKKLGNK